mgnify:FL=1
MGHSFIDAITKRRSYYHLSDSKIVNDNTIIALVDKLLLTMPTPFNVQSTRIVLLFDEQHRELWNILISIFRNMLSPERFEQSCRKIQSAFMSGCGTILFYEDSEALDVMRREFPLYAKNVDRWSEHSSAMFQFAIWTALEDIGYGASLQHYNPLIDNAVMERWLISSKWRLIAQMPFGTPLDIPTERLQRSAPQSRRVVFGEEP